MLDSYHFIGIGGVGMSALARILLDRGFRVSGSDICPSTSLRELEQAGAKITIGHRSENLNPSCRVVYSSDIPSDNPELIRAKELALPLYHRSELLKEMMEHNASLLVAGAHGKTTTSSLLAHVLKSSGLEPSYALGGVVPSLHGNGGAGRGGYFVAEADESDGSFLRYNGWGGILTNIDLDHMDYWKSEQALLRGFSLFASQIQSAHHLFWCRDDERLLSLQLKGVSYGFNQDADLSIGNYFQVEWHTLFDVSFEGKQYKEISLPLIGGHNVLNAAAVFGLCLHLGLGQEQIRQGLASFKGVKRRAEKRGELHEIEIYDDYAHHPTEIYATLRAIRLAIGNRRLVVAFQPHRFTRTKACLNQFSEAFCHADELFITDIYAARELPIEGISSKVLLKKIQEHRVGSAKYVPRHELAEQLREFLKPKDVLVTMGAGDVTQVGQEIMTGWSKGTC